MDTTNPTIGIVGAGGVGGMFGGRWAEAGLEVRFLARGAHLEALQCRGLTIRSADGDSRVEVMASADPAEIGRVDLLVVATKTWQLDDVVGQLAPMVGPSTWVVGLQNGVEAADVISRVVEPSQVLGGTCRVISYIAEPGVIQHIGVEPTALVGLRGGGAAGPGHATIEALCATLSAPPGVTFKASRDIDGDLWRKFLFFAPASGLGSVTQAPIGVLRSVPEVRAMLRQAMEEIHTLARARGIHLADGSVDRALEFFDGLPPEGTSSMQRDFRDGRRTELEALSGAVVRLAAEVGVDVPVHTHLYAALLPQELRARQAIDWPGV